MARRGRTLRAELTVVAFAGLIQVACLGDGGRPSQLVDGSPAHAPPVSLEGVASPQVRTKVNVIDLGDALPALVARCLATAGERTPQGPVVLRIGVDGASVTFATASGGNVVACDGTRVHGGANRPWCGVALGRVHNGRLLDPRLDLAACSAPSGDHIAFAWVHPGRPTRFVAVDRGGFVEVYPIVARLPVRIASAFVDVDTSSASFDVSEHEAEGRLLRSYRLRVRVAG